ncbi:MAG: hypothetical protein EOO90_12905 [Pedobacter sp.]|nr:MAG: hypothetical protein EOO90_12905 [Pedobacter sp.]
MFKQLKDLAGGEYYLIISLLIFMVFFLLVTIHLIRLNKGYINQMSQMPINEPQTINDEEN